MEEIREKDDGETIYLPVMGAAPKPDPSKEPVVAMIRSRCVPLGDEPGRWRALATMYVGVDSPRNRSHEENVGEWYSRYGGQDDSKAALLAAAWALDLLVKPSDPDSPTDVYALDHELTLCCDHRAPLETVRAHRKWTGSSRGFWLDEKGRKLAARRVIERCLALPVSFLYIERREDPSPPPPTKTGGEGTMSVSESVADIARETYFAGLTPVPITMPLAASASSE